MAYRSATCHKWRAARYAAKPLRHLAARGFVLASAIFLLVIMASLAVIIAMVSAASQTTSAQDIQGARAYQAARLGIEAGLYAVQVNGSCPGGTLTGIPGLSGFTVTWTCTLPPVTFKESAVDHTIYQITSTACTTAGSSCPSATANEVAGTDYVERQLVVVTEK
jgi:MSHA biogenesis protein MshP